MMFWSELWQQKSAVATYVFVLLKIQLKSDDIISWSKHSKVN